MDRGVIYVATGAAYVAEALASAASVKQHMPGLPITLFCDREAADPNVDRVVRIEPDRSFPGCAGKIPHIAASPYEQTLFLDSDTYVCGDLGDLFTLLERFDLAAAHAPSRAIYDVDGVPDSFPELNTGVILFRRSPSVLASLSLWTDTFKDKLERLHRDEIRWRSPQDQRVHVLDDQGAFREAMYRSRARIAVLPPEYNCRFSAPGFVDGPVRILHGRGVDLTKVAAAINAISTRRGYQERSGKLRLMSYPKASSKTYSWQNVRYTLYRRGLRWTLAAAARQLRAAARRGRHHAEP